MYNKLFVVCLLLAVAAELIEGKSTFHKRNIQKNSRRSHFQVNKRQSECSSDRFLCMNSGRCIPGGLVCNSDNDCGDGSDEPEDCLTRDCPEGYLKCSNGQCLNTTNYCTGDVRCRGEGLVVSDAACPPVECGADQFACGGVSKCVPRKFVCDTENDCGDGSDEQNCEERVCADDEFRCHSGQCLSKLYYCVLGWASPSCRDGSTPSFTCLNFTCPSEGYHFKCVSNGKCVSNSVRCDGYNNCDDASDEADCPPVQCEPGYARCPTINKCIRTMFFCDTNNDCGDNSDEQNCDERVCADDEVRCRSGQCLSKLSFCTSIISCRDGSSPIEACADFTCPEDNSYFQCASNGKCVSNSSRCDGFNTCDDGSDEADCPPAQCDSGYARCPTSNKCINTRYFCDFDNDCGDNSDESPQLCNDRQCEEDEISCANGQCLNKNGFCQGEYSCRDNSRPSRDLSICPPVQCNSGYARCPSANKCIDTKYFCDTDNDCGDNSDEAPELCSDRVCEDDEIRCANGQCILTNSFCRDALGCRDKSRFSNDTTLCKPIDCESGYSKCPNRNKCVRSQYICDFDNDCGDNSDEEPEVCNNRVCDENEIKCANGQCISVEDFCSGNAPCRDRSVPRGSNPACQAGNNEPKLNLSSSFPVRILCESLIEEQCRAPNMEQQHFDGLRDPGDVFPKLAQIDLREICSPLQEFSECAVTSFDNSSYCQDPTLAPHLRLMREFGPKFLNYVCEENIEVINREKSCLLKLNEQNQPVMMFKLMMSCAPYIIALQSYPNPQQDIYCIPAELQQCAKNAIAEECGDEIATVANGLADLVQDFCKEMQTLQSAPSADPVEQPSYQTYMKRHVRDFARVRKMMKSIF